MRFIRKAFSVAVTVAAVSLGSVGIAGAIPDPYAPVPVNPNNYLVGDTVYFSVGGDNCAIHPNGDVGCDFASSERLNGFIFPIPVNDLAIDIPFLPAHPEFGLTGPHGRPGSPSITVDAAGHWQAGSITYGGATCQAGYRGAWGCTSKGHGFNLFEGATVS